MTKNTTGGSHHKKMSKRTQSQVRYDTTDPNIIEVVVTKALGNSRFTVKTKANSELTCHISSKFSRAGNKRNNFVGVNNIILVSLRDYETPSKNCDYLQILGITEPIRFLGGILDNADSSMDDVVFDAKAGQAVDSVKPQLLPDTAGLDMSSLQDINFDEI